MLRRIKIIGSFPIGEDPYFLLRDSRVINKLKRLQIF